MDILKTLPDVVAALSGVPPIAQYLVMASSVIGAASLLVKAFAIIAKVTPNTKDDILAGQLEKGVSYLVTLLDHVALNPTDKNARATKKR